MLTCLCLHVIVLVKTIVPVLAGVIAAFICAIVGAKLCRMCRRHKRYELLYTNLLVYLPEAMERVSLG